LHDYRNLENAIGSRLPTRDGASRWLPQRMRVALYRFAFQRGSLDASIDAYIVRPFMAVFHSCDGLERRWTDLLSGSPSRESDRVPPLPPIVEEPL
jgi:NAD(P)H-quinone oxidoreductase subunit 5